MVVMPNSRIVFTSVGDTTCFLGTGWHPSESIIREVVQTPVLLSLQRISHSGGRLLLLNKFKNNEPYEIGQQGKNAEY